MDNIFVITTHPMPNGLAGTNRILSLTKGFILNNFNVTVVCINPTENKFETYNDEISGNFQGVNYIYPGNNIIVEENLFFRFIQFVKSSILSFSFIFIRLYKKEVSFIIVYGNFFSLEIPILIFSKIFNIKIYKEESENPYIYFKSKLFTLREGIPIIYVNYIYKLYSGLFLMTNSLKTFFIQKGVKSHKLLLVPHTIDNDRFNVLLGEGANNKFFNYDYIAYIGSMNQQKDGVLDLVKAFSLILKEYKNLRLVIAGEGSKSDLDLFNKTINGLEIKNNIIYLGKLSSIEIPKLLYNAKILVSFRPKSLQSEYGFPSKIVEYLAVGIPIITTLNGDLKLYLKDKINAFIVCDFKIESFVNKLYEVLENYEFALEVAQNGVLLVKNNFNPKINSRLIIDYHNNNSHVC